MPKTTGTDITVLPIWENIGQYSISADTDMPTLTFYKPLRFNVAQHGAQQQKLCHFLSHGEINGCKICDL